MNFQHRACLLTLVSLGSAAWIGTYQLQGVPIQSVPSMYSMAGGENHTAITAASLIQETQPAGPYSNSDPSLFAGYETCKKCHEEQVKKLITTVHFKSAETMHRTPQAKKIASALGLRTIKRSARCVRCHYTPEAYRSSSKAQSGISCESCHGGSKNWVLNHNDYGGLEAKKEDESPEHRQMRIQLSIENGMRHPSKLHLIARSCYECHIVDDVELLTKTEHPVFTHDFDMIRWSQGQMRHNFYRTQGKSNALSEPPRLRLMYLADLVAGLEFGFVAIAELNENREAKNKLVTQTLRRISNFNRAANDVGQPKLKPIEDLIRTLNIETASPKELKSAAENIRKFSVDFFSDVDPAKLSALDRSLPKQSEYRN